MVEHFQHVTLGHGRGGIGRQSGLYERTFLKEPLNEPKELQSSVDGFFLQRFLKKFEKRKVLVVSHRHPDVDAFASAAYLTSLSDNWTLGISGVPFKAVKRMASKFRIRSSLVRNLNLDNYDGVLVVDTADRDRFPRLHSPTVKEIEIVGNIDHRVKRGRNEFKATHLNINNPHFSSTCELLAYYLYPAEKQEAELLVRGIYADTDLLRRRASPLTDSLLFRMQKDFGIDLEVARQDVFEKPSPEEMDMLDAARAKYPLGKIGRLRYKFSELAKPDPPLLTYLARTSLDDAHFAAAFAQYKNKTKTRISIKSWEEHRICLQVMDGMLDSFEGEGGGHETGAGFSVQAPMHKAMEKLKEVLQQILDSPLPYSGNGNGHAP